MKKIGPSKFYNFLKIILELKMPISLDLVFLNFNK